MAITEAFSGTTAAVGTTVHYLTANSTTQTLQTDDGVYQCWIDLGNLAAGDIFQIKVWEKVISSGAVEDVVSQNVAGPVDAPHFVTPTLILIHGWDFSIAKISGTDRAFDYSIRKIA